MIQIYIQTSWYECDCDSAKYIVPDITLTTVVFIRGISHPAVILAVTVEILRYAAAGLTREFIVCAVRGTYMDTQRKLLVL